MKRNFGKITNATTDQLVTLTLQRDKELSSVFSALGENAHKIVHISFQANGKRRMNYVDVEFNMRSERQTHFSFSSYDD